MKQEASAERRVVHAVCTHDCPDSCGVLVTVDTLTGRAVKVQGDPAHPVTRGFLCGKVARYLDRVYSPERLLTPMKRKAGVAKGSLPQGTEAEAFERISWDEALELVAGRLGEIAAEFGPESVLPYSYAGTIGQLGYGSMDRRFFHRIQQTLRRIHPLQIPRHLPTQKSPGHRMRRVPLHLHRAPR